MIILTPAIKKKARDARVDARWMSVVTSVQAYLGIKLVRQPPGRRLVGAPHRRRRSRSDRRCNRARSELFVAKYGRSFVYIDVSRIIIIIDVDVENGVGVGTKFNQGNAVLGHRGHERQSFATRYGTPKRFSKVFRWALFGGNNHNYSGEPFNELTFFGHLVSLFVRRLVGRIVELISHHPPLCFRSLPLRTACEKA